MRGPRSVAMDGATLWVADGWRARSVRRRLGASAMTDPATLRVMSAALSGVAEEMGAALVRAAHSANIKERRDCSTAIFDAGGRMVAQAEHIPVHLGAMPDAVAACRALDPQPGRALHPQRPVHRRHPPARYHARLAGGRPRLRRLPCPSRRRRRDAAGQHAGGRARADPGGSGYPAGAADRRPAESAGGKHAPTPPAAGRSARPDRMSGAGGAAAARAGRSGTVMPSWSGAWTSCIATPSGASARLWPTSPTAAAAPTT